MDDAPDLIGYLEIWNERRLRIASDAAEVALWSWNVKTDRITMDKRAFELWGLPQGGDVTFADLSASIHPDDIDRVRTAFSVAQSQSGPYEIDFRILCSGDVRWISARGRQDDHPNVGRILFGVFLDVSFRMRVAEDRDTATREVQHRIQNLFTLATSLTLIAARNSQTKEAMVDDLTRRLRGLAAAHSLIPPGVDDQRRAVTLRDLLAALLKAYGADANARLSDCRAMVGERAITPIAMLVDDLVTTSTKNGALSCENGQIDVRFQDGVDAVTVLWTERGFSKPATEDLRPGSEMMDRVVKQMNGSVTRHWSDAGLVVTLVLGKTSLGA